MHVEGSSACIPNHHSMGNTSAVRVLVADDAHSALEHKPADCTSHDNKVDSSTAEVWKYFAGLAELVVEGGGAILLLRRY